MVQTRLYNLVEKIGWLYSESASFRKFCSSDGQNLRIAQTISDSFQAAKPQRSLMAPLDFSKAFDRVWREELLLAKSSFRTPSPAGYATFCQIAQLRVQINGERAELAPLREGFCQGAVLSPLLFLLYIDYLRSVEQKTVKVALFADDFSLINSHHNKLAL